MFGTFVYNPPKLRFGLNMDMPRLVDAIGTPCLSARPTSSSVHVEYGLALHDGLTYHAAILPWYDELRKLECPS